MNYHHLFEHTSDPVIEADVATGRVLDANPAACARFGWSRDEWQARDVNVEMALPDVHSQWLQIPAGRGSASLHAAVRTGSGETTQAVVHGLLLPGDAGSRILLVVCDDVHAGAIAAAEREVLEATREFDTLTYNVAHDLRAPLRAIRGFAQMLAEEHAAQLDPEGRRLLDLVLASTNRMRLLVDGLTRFGELSRFVPRREELDMQAIATGVVGQLLAAEAGREVAITLHPLPPAQGDPQSIREVWVQLVDNALKFTRGTPAPTVEIGHDATGGAWYVRDNGVGFDGCRSDRLFELFQRLHSLDDFPGAGVGLAVAKRILVKHGGRIWGEGRPDAGATFRFTLPG